MSDSVTFVRALILEHPGMDAVGIATVAVEQATRPMLWDLARSGATEIAERALRAQAQRVEETAFVAKTYARDYVEEERRERVRVEIREHEAELVAKRAAKEAERCRLRDEERARCGLPPFTSFADDLSFAVNRFREEITLEITSELLASRFAAGPGREVTWGAATVADHRMRIEMQTKFAAGSMEDAARHAEAIRVIEEAGVATLAETVKVAA